MDSESNIKKKQEELKKIQLFEEEHYKIQRSGEKYFKEELHFMYNKKTLLLKNEGEGQISGKDLLTKYRLNEEMRINKKINEKILDDYDFTVMINRLKDFFERVKESPMKGGGGLNQLKDTIRRKIKQIVPR